MIDDYEPKGPDVLYAHVQADSIPSLQLAALDQARTLYGPRGDLAVESMEHIASALNSERGLFRTRVVVRCKNYAEISLPGGTHIPDGLPMNAAELDPAENPSDLALPSDSADLGLPRTSSED